MNNNEYQMNDIMKVYDAINNKDRISIYNYDLVRIQRDTPIDIIFRDNFISGKLNAEQVSIVRALEYLEFCTVGFRTEFHGKELLSFTCKVELFREFIRSICGMYQDNKNFDICKLLSIYNVNSAMGRIVNLSIFDFIGEYSNKGIDNVIIKLVEHDNTNTISSTNTSTDSGRISDKLLSDTKIISISRTTALSEYLTEYIDVNSIKFIESVELLERAYFGIELQTEVLTTVSTVSKFLCSIISIASDMNIKLDTEKIINKILMFKINPKCGNKINLKHLYELYTNKGLINAVELIIFYKPNEEYYDKS